MKVINRFFILICAVAVVLATSISASAIGFDAETIYHSVFVITSGSSLGSGFAIGENCIITNAHVINKNATTRIATYDGKSFNAFLISIDDSLDIAVLGVKGVSFTPLKIADLSMVNVGDDVCAIGAPNSLAYTLTKGVVSAKSRQIGFHKYIQTDAAINSGNSGGPLLNDSGEVIGVNSRKMSDAEGIGLAIPIDEVISYLTNGEISVDDSGNISGIIEEDRVDTQQIDGDNTTEKENELSGLIITLIIALCLSLLGNIAFIITLVYKKQKSEFKPADPSERTDFEIDILE